MAETGRLALRGSFFVAITNYFLQVSSIAFSIVLTRLLSPDDFGVLALATVIYSIIDRVRQLGLTYLLIARKDPSDQAIGTHLTLSVGLSVLVVLLTFALSPILARFYSPQVIAVLQVLAVLHLFDAAGIAATPNALLRKELRFARLSAIDVASTLTSLVLAIGAAWLGCGVWALVVRDGTRIAIQSLGMWIMVPQRPRWAFDWKVTKEFLQQGWHMWVSGLSSYIVFSYDDFLIGNLLGTSALGLYSRAYRYAKLSMSPLAPVYSVLSPTYARLQGDKAHLSKTYTLFLDTVALFAFPAAALMAMAAPELVVVLLTEKWAGVVPLLQFLLPYALLRPIRDGTYSMAVALGMPEIVSRIGVIEAVVMLAVCSLLTWWFGAPGAAISAAIVVLVGLVLVYLWFLREHVQVDYQRIFLPTSASMIIAIAVPLVLLYFMPVENVMVRLVIKLAVGGSTFLAVSFLLQGRRLLEQARYIYRVGIGSGG